jgi:zinc D-Ala-D-Ala dipeptidase
MKLSVFLLLPLMVLSVACYAQPCKTEAKVIATKKEFAESIAQKPEARLVKLQSYIPGLVFDIRYATANNFTKIVLYHNPIAFMRKAPADALKKVQEELNKKGLGLKIYDAYRPFSVTCTMWRLTPDRRYTANPRRGSHHNRGIAADLTVIDLKTGKELDMGTGYDNFTDSAHHNFARLPPAALANRRMLKGIMWQHGFNYVPTEWWHYHWRDKSYDVLDLDFSDLSAALAEITH